MAPDLTTLWPRRAVRLSALLLGFALAPFAEPPSETQTKPGIAAKKSQAAPQRTLRTFQPKPGDTIDDPSSQIVQVLLDRQDKGDFESYMVQVLFRGKPPNRGLKVLSDRVEIDFYDTGKPSMRLARIRGGAIEASSVDEFFYRDHSGKAASGHADSLPKEVKPKGALHGKRMVRLTLFMHAKAEIKFRDTLDRTLIHFRFPKNESHGNRDGK